VPTDGTGIAGKFQERTSMDATPFYNISFPGKEAVTMLDKLPLNGKKTYVVAGLTVLYCVCGLLIGEIPTNEALMGIAAALGITTIGHKIDKSTSN
tara:strand:+ start:102412 stop:102699 length:288 start_codon:yes stop_codon:yes gene_type:complete